MGGPTIRSICQPRPRREGTPMIHRRTVLSEGPRTPPRRRGRRHGHRQLLALWLAGLLPLLLLGCTTSSTSAPTVKGTITEFDLPGEPTGSGPPIESAPPK